jgi:hypothetical protein
VRGLVDALRAGASDAAVTPGSKVESVLKLADELGTDGKPVTLAQVERLRRQISGAYGGAQGDDKTALRQMGVALDGWMEDSVT